MIAISPMATIRKPAAPPGTNKNKINIWNKEEIKQFLEDDRLETLYVLALTCGMRQGELLARTSVRVC